LVIVVIVIIIIIVVVVVIVGLVGFRLFARHHEGRKAPYDSEP